MQAATDHERDLTERGVAQVQSAALWLADYWQDEHASPAQLFVSPYRRAQQSAAAFMTQMHGLAPVSSPFLTPDTSLAELDAALADMRGERVLLVGHNPLFSNAISWFCGNELREAMAPASMACIELAVVARNSGRLRWLRHAPDYTVNARSQ